MQIKFSMMNVLDIPDVMELEEACFTSAWSESAFREELAREYSYILLARDEGGRLAGFICFWRIVDEMHILNIAVRQEMRRRGIGRALVEEAIEFAAERGARTATLEVRESNLAAIELYAGMGFDRAGIRKRYYDSPTEDAVIMWAYDLEQARRKSP